MHSIAYRTDVKVFIPIQVKGKKGITWKYTMEYITDSVSMLFYHPSLQDSDQHLHAFEHACEKLHSNKNPSKKRNYTNSPQSLPENRSRGRVLFLFTYMNFCRKSHRIKSNKLKNLLELISNYGKVQDTRLIYQKKATAFLYNNSDQLEYEIKNTISFTLAPQKKVCKNKSLKICTRCT